MNIAHCKVKNGGIPGKECKKRVAENRNEDSGRERDRSGTQRNQPCTAAQTAMIFCAKVLTGEHRHG